MNDNSIQRNCVSDSTKSSVYVPSYYPVLCPHRSRLYHSDIAFKPIIIALHLVPESGSAFTDTEIHASYMTTNIPLP
jgi:hypothetical protein